MTKKSIMMTSKEKEEPDYNPKSPDRQMSYRTRSLRLWGGMVDEELAELEKTIKEVLEENPDLTREDLTLSTEAEPEEYEDWYNGVLSIGYYTPETDEEMKWRLDNLNSDVKELRRLMALYPEEVDKFMKN